MNKQHDGMSATIPWKGALPLDGPRSAPTGSERTIKPRTRSRASLVQRGVLALLVAASALGASSGRGQPSIPATFALPSSAADTSRPGFIWRVHQVATPQLNINARTEMQLAGLLGDNIADPNAQGIAMATASSPSPSSAPIAFDISGVINMNIWGGSYDGNFYPDDQMPGLPGTTGSTDNIAGEVLTWLDLPAGTITMGVNSDDGFRMSIGGFSPGDQFAVKVGEFSGGRGAADTIFSFTLAQAGLYAVRCTWEQGFGGANLEMFSFNWYGGKVLVNDTWNGGIPAYRAVTAPARAYARKVSPAPGSSAVYPDAPILVELVDGASPIDPASVKVSLDGIQVPATRSKAGSITTVSYNRPSLYAPGSLHAVAFAYTEGASPVTVNWSFAAANYMGPGGHLYEVVLLPTPVTWPDARTAAENLTLCGGHGHLATITSSTEDVFLEALRRQSPPSDSIGMLWVGGYQTSFDTEPGGNWIWLNGEGAIPGVNGGATYANWLPTQPDNSLGAGGEDFLTIGLNNNLGWNDDGYAAAGPNGAQLEGYVVEFEPPYVFQAPFVQSMAPQGGNVRADAIIVVSIVDGTTTHLKPTSIKLTLNGSAVTPQVSSAGGITTLRYEPPRYLAPGSNNVVAVTFSDSAGRSYTETAVFQTAQYIGPSGNFYEVVQAPTHVTWPNAKLAAEQRVLGPQHGHLATITTVDEDFYLERVREISPPWGGFGQLWVGGYQDPSRADWFEPAGGWVWVNNEGPISGYNGGPTYANWQYPQPDNAYSGEPGGGENYLAIGLNNQFGWNDDGYLGDGRHDGTLDGYVVEYEALVVTVDIKPGEFPNKFNPFSQGKLPVAILSTATFNAKTVDPASVRFGKTGTEAAAASWSYSDVNKDGKTDLLLLFPTTDTGLICGDTKALITGATLKGFPLKGSDSVQLLQCPDYGLSILAMQDVRRVTDVYLTVGATNPACVPPTVASHVQLQSYDIFGRLWWSKNAQNVPMVLNLDNTSTGDLQYGDLVHFQPIKAQVQVQNSFSGNTEILRQNGVVLLRPDVAVNSVDAPASAYPGVVVNITAFVAELNGDLGASGTVYLMEGTTVLDHASGFIGPKGTAAVVFSTTLTSLGTHQFKVVVGDETPADYDLSNNERDFSIEVTEPPAYFSASYDHSHEEFFEEYNYPWWEAGTIHNTYNTESFGVSLSIPVAVALPLTDVAIQTFADGNQVDNFDLPNLDADYSYPPPYYYAQTYRHLADGLDFYLSIYSYPWFQTTYAQFSRNAADNVYYSAWHNYYWNSDGQSSSVYQYGTFLNAATSVGAQFTLQSGASTYGGTIDVPLYSSSWDYSFVYYDDPSTGAYDRGWDRRTSIYGYNSGLVTP